MKFTILSYEDSLLPLYNTISRSCRIQDSSDFPIPESKEGEEGFLFLCKENDTIYGALSAVTYDKQQYFFYPWCDSNVREQIADSLYNNFESYLTSSLKDQTFLLPLTASCYVHSCASHTGSLLLRHGYTCTAKEYLMQYSLHTASKIIGGDTPDSVLCMPSDQPQKLKKLYQDIFQTSKKEAAAYISSLMEDDGLQLYVLYETASLPRFQKAIGMFGLLTEGTSACLFSFGICPKKRRQGFATAALDAICTMLQKRFQSISVQVSGKNLPAMTLYQKYGFQVTDCVDLYEKNLNEPY